MQVVLLINPFLKCQHLCRSLHTIHPLQSPELTKVHLPSAAPPKIRIYESKFPLGRSLASAEPGPERRNPPNYPTTVDDLLPVLR